MANKKALTRTGLWAYMDFMFRVFGGNTYEGVMVAFCKMVGKITRQYAREAGFELRGKHDKPSRPA